MSQQNRLIAGRYELRDQIGAGAMGVVWRAGDLKLERVVAVKELLLPSHFDAQAVQQARRRAQREARIAARLHHPNAITVHDVVEQDGQPWLIMEYLPSQSLAAILAERGPLPVGDAVRIGKHMADALAAAHKASVVHRDVKPGNVLLGAEGTVKITDFGISRALDDTTATATGHYAGTPAFFAPEVARGQEAGYPSDVFSLGATLYNAVEGVPPFGITDNSIAQLYRAAAGTIRPPERAGALTPLLARLLDLDPRARPTMAEAAEALDVLARSTAPTPTLVVDLRDQLTSSFTLPPRSPSHEQRSRRRAAAGLAVALVVLIAVVSGAFYYANVAKRSEASTPPPSSSSSAPPKSTSAKPPVTAPLVVESSGKCLDVPGKATENGTAVTIFDCNGGDNQLWTPTAAGELRVYNGAKCLDARLAGTEPGTSVDIHDCNGGANQKWALNADRSITGKQSGLCLDVLASGTDYGTPVVLWTCAGGTNQRWSHR
ncbi:protein kinase [Umezawaea endophytica]|uniref:non-specific serine/threonine protein kinase n=1 Tax=Umezawaea endophytica TaxID=1654476 RepID=A0A9X2VN10_9PSEU|nr:serine/threonine protein kinase [Umezawaea endophytica]MCS7479472.1 serine/threonine protein kinase [Umezawaea endophytica]